MIETRPAIWDHADEHKASLLQATQRARRANPHSNLGVMRGPAWSSPKTLGKAPELAPLIEWIREEIGQGKLDVWANALEVGAAILEHDHNQADVTAVYCVEGSGDILLPGGTFGLFEGAMLIMDGTLPHSVEPVESPRTSIVVNLYG